MQVGGGSVQYPGQFRAAHKSHQQQQPENEANGQHALHSTTLAQVFIKTTRYFQTLIKIQLKLQVYS